MTRKLTNEEVQRAMHERIALCEQIRKLDAFVEAAQNICHHNMVDNGHDSHYNHMICTKCGYEDLKC